MPTRPRPRRPGRRSSKSRTRCCLPPWDSVLAEGHEGWDEYAPFYDWENARTLGRRDVPFWRNLALQAGGRVLELGCGTGRIALPLARAGVPLVGIDRSDAMLKRALTRVRRGKLQAQVRLIRGDIRRLPFATPARRT